MEAEEAKHLEEPPPGYLGLQESEVEPPVGPQVAGEYLVVLLGEVVEPRRVVELKELATVVHPEELAQVEPEELVQVELEVVVG